MFTLKSITLLFLCFLLFACATADSRNKAASSHYLMGLSYLGEGNYTGALVELSEAEKITPDDPDLLHKLALAYFYKKKYDLAEQRYLKSLKIKSDNSELRNNLGVNYLQMSRWDDAIQQFRLVMDDIFFRDQDSAAINLALAYYGKGEYPQALSVLRSFIGANPSNILGRLHLGRTYAAMNRHELAAEEFRRALETNRDFVMAHYQLALVYLQQKKTPQAVASFKEVVRLAPDSEIGQLSREQLDLLK